MDGFTVNQFLPKSPQEADLLQRSIERLLRQIPVEWETIDLDAITAFDGRAMVLLLAAGLVERKVGLRIDSLIDSFAADIEFVATGEYGVAEALQPVILQMWLQAQESYGAWLEQHGDKPTARCIMTSNAWRLTDQGVIARADLDQTEDDRSLVFEFVLRVGRFARRDSIRGAGQLKRFDRPASSTPADHPVTVTNWDQGAEAFAHEIIKQLGLAVATAQQGPIPPVMPRVSLEPPQITFESHAIALSLEAAHYLDVLVQHYGERMSDREVVEVSAFLRISFAERPRLKEVRESMPPTVRAWLDCNNSGTKFRRPPP